MIHTAAIGDDARREEAATWVVRLQSPVIDSADAAAFGAWLHADAANGYAYDEALAVWREYGASALAVARWLEKQPQVARILHPAFESCPGHEYWKRDFKGSAGLFSFVLKGGDSPARDALIDSLELFGIGYSWGGFESLVTPAEPVRTATAPEWGGPVVRLQIGLEDPEDLIADLARALASYA